MTNLINKTKKAFQRCLTTKIHLREKEIAHIKQFLANNDNILHICGNPGTGKTSTVLFVLKNKNYSYTNFLENQNIVKNIKNTKHDILVIDEFDKLYQTNTKECLKLFDYIEQKNKKLITISNSLGLTDHILYFDAYTPAEINTIVKLKISDEIGAQIVDDKLLNFISKKYGNAGDIRKVFDYIKDLIDKKENNSHQMIKIEDLIENTEKKDEENFHEKIIKSIINQKETKNKAVMYKLYYSECDKLNIQPLNRNDVYLIYDLHK